MNVEPISPHTVKKFELVEGYVKAWKEKLLNIPACKNLIFIDCMSNRGEYTLDGQKVFGTPVRVDELLRRAAEKYTGKNISVIFNDISAGKIEHLKTLIPEGTRNYHVRFYNEDCNTLLLRLGRKIFELEGTHCLLVYDPYDASINWKAIMPFINNWGEVIINHMASDPIRAASSAIKQGTVSKYEAMYQTLIEEILTWGSDRRKYEECVESIIRSLRNADGHDYFIASFPFFNKNNVFLYDLIHCTGNIEGLKLFKKTAWQVFGGNSSNKKTLDGGRQEIFEFHYADPADDDDCYHFEDIIRYVVRCRDKNSIPSNDEIHAILDRHPVFPSDGFMKKISRALKRIYAADEAQLKINFN